MQDSFNNFLDDYFNHSFRVPVRRPLLSALAALIIAVGVVVFLFPPQIPDLEAWRGSRVTLAGTIRALEPKLEGEDTVWRMTLSDISLSDASLSDSSLTDASPADKSTADTVTTDRMPADTSTGDPSLPDPDAAALSPGKKGLVLCVLDAEPQTDIGARVEVCGTVIPFRSAMNEGEFDVRLYYHILRIDYSLRDVEIMAASKPAGILAPTLFHVRKTADDIIDRCFSQRNAPTIKAILLGEKGLLDEDTKDLYQGAGIIHILSISGLHLSLIGMGLFGLLGKLRLPLPGQNSARRRSKSFISPSGHPRHPGRSIGIRLGTIPLPGRAAVSLAAVFLYGKMAGMGMSAFRALVMLSLYITAKAIGRTYDLLTAAGIAAALLLLDQPLYLLHTGFQFSFCAVLSMGILAPALPGKILKAAAVPLGTLPVYLRAYGTFPLWSLLLNLLVTPLMTVVMPSAGSAVLAEGLFPSGGAFSPAALAAFPAEAVLDLYRFLAELSEKLPLHRLVIGRPSPAQNAVYYAMLLALSAVSVHLQMPHVRRSLENAGLEAGFITCDPRNSAGPDACGSRNSACPDACSSRNSACPDAYGPSMRLTRLLGKLFRRVRLKDNWQRKRFGGLSAVLCLCAAVLVLTRNSGPAFEMDFLYVGQGDGIYISCDGMRFLVDGGSSTKEELAKYTILPFLRCKGAGRLDGIILTHEDGDHCSGILELLEAAAEGAPELDIGHIYLPEIDDASKGEKYRRIEELAEKAGIPVSGISRGQRIRAGSLTLDCLHPASGASYERPNEYSTTLLLRRGDFSALLTGDLDGQGEEDLTKYLLSLENGSQSADGTAGLLPLPVSLLKVSHHGSKYATSEQFLELVAPESAVISAGLRNLYGHPHEELLERLSAAVPSDRIFRTDLSGEVSVVLKGSVPEIKGF